MSEPSDDPPKIIVDDDWKTQVEKEKLAAARAAASPAKGTSESGAAGAKGESETPGQEIRGGKQRSGEQPETPPPATFEMLITMLFTQAMASLGQLPGPDGNMGPVNKAFAKYFIDTVELLGEKTKGNLTSDESKMITEALHAMRMAFVSVKAK